MKRELSLFASTAPGLEPIAEGEVRALGVTKARVVPGGVELSADRSTVFRLLVELRTVSHLLLRVAKFRADRFDWLEREIRALDWKAWLLPRVPRKLRVTSEKSRLFHTDAVAERLTLWIGELLGDGGEGEGEPVTVAARIVHDEVTISIDLSGEPLHRRGYRLDPGKAPLREDLAAALVIASGWNGETPLIDPLCGSGTIAIEAVRIGLGRAPGLARGFAIERTRIGNAADVERARRAAREAEREVVPRVIASDRDARAIERARQNTERAGIAIALQTAPLSSVDVDALIGTAPVVVTNPPWGERMEEAGAGFDRLYQSLGVLVRKLGPGARLALITADARLARSVGLPLRSAFLTDAGGVKVHAMVSASPADHDAPRQPR